MKKIILTMLIALTAGAGVVIAGNPGNVGKYPRVAAINAQDTVVFDLSQATTFGDDVQFPVYIMSDDTVNALDFSFKFNHANLIYDSIINLTLHLQPVSYYDTLDSIVRFSSFNTDRYKNDTPIVAIRFTTIFNPISSSDLSTIKVYLNGNPCSYKIINSIPTGLLNIKEDESVKVYPNPVREKLNIDLPEKAIVELLDVSGKRVIEPIAVNGKQSISLNTQDLANGIYMMKVYNDGFLSIKKVVISQ